MLKGIRVLDMTHFLAGPFCTLVLADLGADVIRIEDPGHPDEARSMPPHFLNGESLYYLSLNWGKRSAAVPLSTPKGRELMYRMVRRVDLVVDNSRPGVMRSLGLDHDSLAAINGRVVTCSITGFGEDGPYAGRPGYDYTITALTGIQSLTGDPPTRPGISYVDHSAGLAGALAMVSALWQRERTGLGRHLDVSLMDTQLSFLTYVAAFALNAGDVMQSVPGGGHPVLVPTQNFATTDGYVALFIGNDAMWKRAVEVLEVPELRAQRFATIAGRQAEKSDLLRLIADRLIGDTTSHWVNRFERARIPCAPVNRIDQALQDPQVLARGMVVHDDHPVYGKFVHLAGPFPKFRSGFRPAPTFGEHTDEVLRELGEP